MSLLSKWLAYTKARIRSAVRSGNEDLDRKEARLEAEQRGTSLGSDSPTPSFDEAKEAIHRRTGKSAGDAELKASDDDTAFELAAQDREAQERLKKIRESLDQGDDKPPRRG